MFPHLHGLRRAISIAALAIFAIIRTAATAPAQDRHKGYQPDSVPEHLLSARNQQQAGEYQAARNILLRALTQAPNSASLLNQLGSVQQDLGEYLEAERSYLRALSASSEGAREVEHVFTLHNLATLYLDTGQYAKGERVREQLQKLPPGVLDNHPAEVGVLWNVIGSLEHARDRDDEAERYYSRSLTLLRQARGPASVEAGAVETNRGFMRLQKGEYTSAASLLEQAIRETEIASGPETPALIRPLILSAKCQNMIGHANEAEVLARRAVELSAKFAGEGHPQTATAMLEQAAALRRLHRKDSARHLEKRAKAGLQRNSTINLSGYTIGLRDLSRR